MQNFAAVCICDVFFSKKNNFLCVEKCPFIYLFNTVYFHAVMIKSMFIDS